MLLMLALFAVSRIPGLLPQNFSAAYALAFCAGVYFPGSLAWWLPLSVMLGTDVVLNLTCYHTAAVNGFMLATYPCYAALIWLGRRFTARASWLALLGGGILGAILFYLVTNTLAWLQNPVYAKTLLGWLQSLTTGQPGYPPTWEFFRNTLLSGGLFTGLFVGAAKLTEVAESPAEKGEPAEDAEEEAPEEAQA